MLPPQREREREREEAVCVVGGRGGGGKGKTCCFWCESRLRRRDTFLFAQLLVIKWLDSYQIFIAIELRYNKE